MSEERSDQTGSAVEREIAHKVAGKGGAMVIVVVVLALVLLMAFNMN